METPLPLTDAVHFDLFDRGNNAEWQQIPFEFSESNRLPVLFGYQSWSGNGIP
jgi:hypothetical protein